ncbi:MAG: SIMPL domain-containing protein [Janthinobacterium lividum]
MPPRLFPLRLAGIAPMLLSAAAVAQVPDPAAGASAGGAPADGTMLTVSARGRVSRVPDLATIRAGVVTQGATAAGALAENAARVDKVIAALRTAGIAPRDLSTASVSLQPQYRYADGQAPVVTGYQATNAVSVRFHDIARAGRVLDTLVAQGANQIEGPNLSLENPDAALDEARTDAVRRARARADLYAAAAGLHVQRIVSISEEGEESAPPAPVMFRMRAEAMAAAPSTQLLPGQTDVAATLSVRFLLR